MLSGWACVIVAGCSEGNVDGNMWLWRCGIYLVLFGLMMKVEDLNDRLE